MEGENSHVEIYYRCIAWSTVINTGRYLDYFACILMTEAYNGCPANVLTAEYAEFDYRERRQMANKRTNNRTSRTGNDDNGIFGELIDRVTELAEIGRETAASWVETVSPDAATMIRPEPKRKTSSSGSTKVILIKTGPAAKSTAKKSPAKKAGAAAKGAAKKAASKTKASVKPAGKLAAKKSSAKTGASTKNQTGAKGRTAARKSTKR